MSDVDITLRPWRREDLDLIKRLNAPEMTEHLGGPEPDTKLKERLERYVSAASGNTRMFVIEVSGIAAGSVGYWPREWQGQPQFETGWGVFPEYQGKGVATTAIRLLMDEARRNGINAPIHAFPEIHNVASNALCRKAGFRLLGTEIVEYPPGNPITVNDWVVDNPKTYSPNR